ncbi:50S ribosomal protein L18 [Patescibacteria group bacterium]|nr:50S ribosomal protein L18 [Patescibacteria group bacterium]
MKNKEILKNEVRLRIHSRVRSKISGTSKVPRLSVFRSNKEMFVQIINDETGKTLASVNVKELDKPLNKTDVGKQMGKLIAKKAQEKKITKVVFDRGRYKYHGRVKAVAESAREGGLIF